MTVLDMVIRTMKKRRIRNALHERKIELLFKK